MNNVLQILHVVSWPLAIVAIVVVFHVPLGEVIRRLHKVKANLKGVELVLEKLEKDVHLSVGARVELSGLSSNDIWALESFASQAIPPSVNGLNAPQRVAARTLFDAGLISVDGIGLDRKLRVTPLGHQLLQAANTLF
jgi:hypothetical protein